MLSPDDGSAYKLQALATLPGGWAQNPHLRLNPDEEQRVLGTGSLWGAAAAEIPGWRRLGQFAAIDAAVLLAPVDSAFVTEAEQQLLGLVEPPAAAPSPLPAYPLRKPAASGGTLLAQEMHQELGVSWAAHHSHPAATRVKPAAQATIQAMLVGEMRL